MKVIVPTNNKGGTGKTTIATILCHYFANKGKRVLGIDLDPQCNFSRRFLDMDTSEGEPVVPPPHPEYDANDPDWESLPNGVDHSASLFLQGGAFIYPTDFERIHIIPGHEEKLLEVERVTIQRAVSDVYYQIQKVLSDPYFEENYDYIIIDTGPSKGPLTSSAVHAATHIIIPVKMEEMSIEGLNGMMSFWERVNQARSKEDRVKLLGILPNLFKAQSGLHHFYYEQIEKDETLSPYLIRTVMHDWQDYAESSMRDTKPLLSFAPSNKTRQEAEEICRYIENKL